VICLFQACSLHDSCNPWSATLERCSLSSEGSSSGESDGESE
jgi:hypothetical protein